MVKRRLQHGQGLTEYIIIVGLIAIALIVVVAYFGLRSKQTVARSGTALGGGEATATSNAEAASPGTASASGQGGAASAAAPSPTSSASGGGRAGAAGASTPSVVSGGDGKLASDFKATPRPDPGSFEVKEESAVMALPETAESDVMAALGGDAGRRGSSRGGYAVGGGDGGGPGFPVGLLALILLVAVGGGFVMVFLMKRT